MKKVFVYGDFNIFHPGHLRLLKFAKQSGDYLVVGVNSDNISSKNISQDIRIESIKATSYVDEAFILDYPAIEYIKKNKPDIVVKGKEHEYKENLEESILKSYGGKLLFTSGDIGFASLELLKKEFLISSSTIEHNYKYLKRHNINLKDLKNIIENFKKLNVLVIGDTIVDEYITCEPLGMSQEDPTIVVSPLFNTKFVGGAAIVASHAKTLGANVNFISVLGDDEHYDYVKDNLSDLNININLIKDDTRPTTLKQRFRANNKTLLRVNHLKQHDITSDVSNDIFQYIKSIKGLDLIIFSDFSYGVLTDKLIEDISSYGKENNILMVADSQSSSQVGDISKFKDMSLVTPTEREVRLSLNDFDSGLVVLSEKLKTKSNPKHIFTTLGAEGMMIYDSLAIDAEQTDTISPLGETVKDVSGAGDSLLTCSSMALCLGASIWQSAYLGSLTASIQVSRVGNIPIKKDELLKELK